MSGIRTTFCFVLAAVALAIASADAGLASGYKLEMVIINNPPQRRVGEVIQGMAREAGTSITRTTSWRFPRA